jgi:hypothetical protein
MVDGAIIRNMDGAIFRRRVNRDPSEAQDKLAVYLKRSIKYA